jgi:hypothetical protein
VWKKKGEGRRTSSIPRAEEVHAAGEETSLEKAEENTAGVELLMVLDKAHANHDGTPEKGDERQVNTRSDLSHEDRGRGLEENIGNEEEEICDILPNIHSVSSYHPSRRPKKAQRRHNKRQEMGGLRTYVSVISGKTKLKAHTSNVCKTHVDTIHERDAVHQTNRHNKTVIDATNDSALLLLTEAKLIGVDAPL